MKRMIRWCVVIAGLMSGGFHIKEARGGVNASGAQVEPSWTRLELLTIGGPERYVNHSEHSRPPPRQELTEHCIPPIRGQKRAR